MPRVKRGVCGLCGKPLAIKWDLPVEIPEGLYCGRCDVEHTHPSGQSEAFSEGITHAHPGSAGFQIGGQTIAGHDPRSDGHRHATMRMGFD